MFEITEEEYATAMGWLVFPTCLVCGQPADRGYCESHGDDSVECRECHERLALRDCSPAALLDAYPAHGDCLDAAVEQAREYFDHYIAS